MICFVPRVILLKLFQKILVTENVFRVKWRGRAPWFLTVNLPISLQMRSSWSHEKLQEIVLAYLVRRLIPRKPK